jgi:hypothetical protein
MTKINIITPPDKIYNETYSIQLIFPSKITLDEVQKQIIEKVDNLNVYLYNKSMYTKDDVNWLLDTFFIADFVLIDIDNSPPYLRDLLSFLISKPKTYWLTNANNCIYNHISNNRLYNLEILSRIGDKIEES